MTDLEAAHPAQMLVHNFSNIERKLLVPGIYPAPTTMEQPVSQWEKDEGMRRTNFLLIITDQQRCDHLGAYGNRIVDTPNVDALAARGWVADRFYVASPACMPNRASLMTGRLPSLHGVRHNGIPLPLMASTFVDVLKQAGWRTALVGKAHLQNMTGKSAVWPPAAKRLSREAEASVPGNYGQEWGPHWRERADFKLDLPFYGFDDVSLAVDHGDRVLGHYWRWLEETHPEIAAFMDERHLEPLDLTGPSEPPRQDREGHPA